VTKIKTYPDPPAGDGSSNLEGEESQG